MTRLFAGIGAAIMWLGVFTFMVGLKIMWWCDRPAAMKYISGLFEFYGSSVMNTTPASSFKLLQQKVEDEAP